MFRGLRRDPKVRSVEGPTTTISSLDRSIKAYFIREVKMLVSFIAISDIGYLLARLTHSRDIK